jgi:L-seryl-tRNA(Ser) seleniumtransferase
MMVYNPYEKYGIRRVINAVSCLTRLGGSIAHPEVYRAMEDASKSFVQIPELQQWAGKAIAEATGAEAGLPTAGASSAIMLAAAACIMKGTELENYDPLDIESWTHIIKKLPMHTEGLKTEFIVQKSDRNIYDHAVECAGGRFVEVESGEKELIGAYDANRTAAYYFTVRSALNSIPLNVVIRVAHENSCQVIVDAAAELPPRENLRRYISMGADLVIFSGGKYIAGPNNSGILAGRKDLIKLAHLQSYPFHGVGRAAKMSKETIVGFVTALKLYLRQDEGAKFNDWLNKAKWISNEFTSMPGIESGIDFQSTVEEDEHVVPVSYIKLNKDVTGITGKELSEILRSGDPSIETAYEPAFMLKNNKNKLVVNPEFLLEGEDKIIIDAIKKILKENKK